MAKSRGDLFAGARKESPAPKPEPQPVAVEVSHQIKRERRWPKNKTREGRKFVGAYIDPAAHDILRELAYRERKEVQLLLKEALNLLFDNRGKPTVALGEGRLG